MAHFIVNMCDTIGHVWFLNQNELSKIYKPTVQPSIDYALSILGNCNEYSKNIIVWLEKRVARIVTGHFYFINVRYYEWAGVADVGPKKNWLCLKVCTD